MRRIPLESMKKFAGLLLVLTLLFTVATLATAQNAPDKGKLIAPTGTATVTFLGERSPEDMDRFEATFMPPPSHEAPVARPTMDAASYAALKGRAARAASFSKPGAGESPTGLAITNKGGHSGCQQSDNTTVGQPLWYPPDSEGAVSTSQVVEAINNLVCVYSKSTGVLLKEISGNALVGYGTEYTFDPQVAWDPLWGRWVITEDAFPENSNPQTIQYFFEAVSKTSSATGAWYIYTVNTNAIDGCDCFWDYPKLGMSQNGLIFTANIFPNAGGFNGASLYSVSKAQNYNGHPQGFSYYNGLEATLQPPRAAECESGAPCSGFVNDINAYSWLIAAPATSGSNTLFLVALGSAGDVPTSLIGYYEPTTAITYSVPPAAYEGNCGGYYLDSLDGRFQWPSTQSNDNLYAVHTTDLGNAGIFPAPVAYRISGLQSFAPAVAEEHEWFRSGTSYDFNPSIAADSSNHYVIGWSATDPGVGVTSEVLATDNNGGPNSGIVLQNNSVCLTGNGGTVQRWGDYSSTQLDPSTAKTFWTVNETINGASDWGTFFGKVLW